MIGVEHIEEWRGQTVLDADGADLGKLEEIYFDSGNSEPVLVAVKSGLLGRHSALVPIDGAAFGRDYVRLAHRKETVDAAGSSDAVPEGEELARLGSAYGVSLPQDAPLQSASEMEARNAHADAARQRAAELAEAAREKLSAHEQASERAQSARADAERAHEEAEQARQAALEAREQARRYE
jgi:PRC-barrel domain